MDPKDLEDLISDCEYDTCFSGDENDEIFCSEAELLVELCREKYNMSIEDWRDDNFCRNIDLI